MQAVVLAAGFGTRLAPIARGTPKPLVELCGRPLLEHVLSNLAAGGVSEAVIVAGQQHDLIRSSLVDLAPYGLRTVVVENPCPELGNGSSLLAAGPHLSETPFLVAMSDHLARPELVSRLIESAREPVNFLAVDHSAWVPAQVADATRVLVGKDGMIRRMGKGLQRFNAIDTGFYVFQSGTLQLARAIMGQDGALELGDLAGHLARSEPGLRAVDVSGHLWIDVDGPGDFAFATDVLRAAELSPLKSWLAPNGN